MGRPRPKGRGPAPIVEITLATKDLKTLYFIKDVLGFGEVTKRSNVEAYRYRIGAGAGVLNIIERINGLLLTESKHAQLIKLCKHFKINPKVPDSKESLRIIKHTC